MIVDYTSDCHILTCLSLSLENVKTNHMSILFRMFYGYLFIFLNNQNIKWLFYKPKINTYNVTRLVRYDKVKS